MNAAYMTHTARETVPRYVPIRAAVRADTCRGTCRGTYRYVPRCVPIRAAARAGAQGVHAQVMRMRRRIQPQLRRTAAVTEAAAIVHTHTAIVLYTYPPCIKLCISYAYVYPSLNTAWRF